MPECVIGIGSNINAVKNIKMALDALHKLGRVRAVSDIIETKPVGLINQANFSNGALLLWVDLTQEELNKQLKQIEDQLGRDRSRPKFGPREIDLDIIIYDNQVVDQDYYTRDFLRQVVHQVWTKK